MSFGQQLEALRDTTGMEASHAFEYDDCINVLVMWAAGQTLLPEEQFIDAEAIAAQAMLDALTIVAETFPEKTIGAGYSLLEVYGPTFSEERQQEFAAYYEAERAKHRPASQPSSR